MPIEFPGGAVIGIIGETGAGQSELLRLASETAGSRYLGPADALDLSPAPRVLIEHTFAHHDAFTRARAISEMGRLRASGNTILIVSHELDLLQSICDEIWWLEAGSLRLRGDPREVLDAYRASIAAKVRAWGGTQQHPLTPAMRRGDGRAKVLSLETLDAQGAPTSVWKSGESVCIRVAVQYCERVDEPVIGIMIRTRIGLEVYGTNTELEKISTGTCEAATRLQIEFAFQCDLCPGEYTITAASHDADGAHDWLDDAVAFSVVGSRYTAGVANLRAKVTLARL